MLFTVVLRVWYGVLQAGDTVGPLTVAEHKLVVDVLPVCGCWDLVESALHSASGAARV